MATVAAATTFTRVWNDPQSMVARNQFEVQTLLYAYRWHLYQNSVFDDTAIWQMYRRRYGLYRYIRPIYNPVRRLVDFYAGIVYPGVLAVDAKRLPDGTALAIPLAQDINPQLRDAIGQLWQWSNWQSGKNLMVRYGAALGDVGVEVVDEVDRGKVTFAIMWPGLITDLELDGTGNVKRYVVEYDADDVDGKKYTYRKEVDGEWIAEYKDRELFQYDDGIDAKRRNPYGFAPMVWCKHTDLGGEHGSPAVRNAGKIDELNEMASHAHDRAHAVLSSPMFASGKGVRALTSAVTESKRVATEEMADITSGRESVKLFTADEGGSISAVQLPEGEALNFITKLIEEIEHDHPELTMYNELRQMSQVTGPGAERMIGDAASLVLDARSSYDTQSIKLFQMSIAIAGWRANSGAWGRNLTRQQRAFAPFDLESYNLGALDFDIMPRPLLPATKMTADEQRALMESSERGFRTRARVVEALGGDPETDIPAIDVEQEAKRIREADLAQAALEEARRNFDQDNAAQRGFERNAVPAVS